MEIPISELDSISKNDVSQINALFAELSPGAKKQFTRKELLKKPWNQLHVVVAHEQGTIVGMATLYVAELLPKTIGKIEDVVVLQTHRGKKLGERLTVALLEIGKQKNCAYIELTSKPKREAANKMYQKLGFVLMAKAWQERDEEKKELVWIGTNYYRYTFV